MTNTISKIGEQNIWAEKYRPRKISECILPKTIKAQFQAMVDSGKISHMSLAGGPGIGKTTVAMALLEESGYDAIKINASMHSGIDTLRNDVYNYVTTQSLEGNKKGIVFDESDNMTAATQGALRAFIEDFSKNCVFIFTANNPRKIIPAISDSRAPQINMSIPKSEKDDLISETVEMVASILEKENVTYDEDGGNIIVEIIKNEFPNIRKILTVLQHISATGHIDKNSRSMLRADINTVIPYIKNKSYSPLRLWVSENVDGDGDRVILDIWNNLDTIIAPESHAEAILILAEAINQLPNSLSQDITITSMLVRLGMECKFQEKGSK